MNTQTALKTVELEKFLVRVSALIKAQGYVSNSEVKGTAKKSTAMLAFEWADNFKPREIMSVAFDATDKAVGKEVADWMGGTLGEIELVTSTYHGLVKFAPAREYMAALYRIGQSKQVDEHTMGYAASAINAFEKEKNKNSEEKNSLDEIIAALGNPGTKTLGGIKVIFIGKSQFESKFGTCHKYQFEDVHQHKIVWMTSIELPNLTQGNAYSIDGTIKEYSTFRGRHECVLTRAKIS